MLATKILSSAIKIAVAVEPASRLLLDASFRVQLKDVNSKAQKKRGK